MRDALITLTIRAARSDLSVPYHRCGRVVLARPSTWSPLSAPAAHPVDLLRELLATAPTAFHPRPHLTFELVEEGGAWRVISTRNVL